MPKDKVDLEVSSDDIHWSAHLRATDEVLTMEVQGADSDSGELKIELSVKGPLSILDELGQVAGHAVAHLGLDVWPSYKASRTYSLEDKRKVHAKAYYPWLPEEDERLRLRNGEGASIDELVLEFERGEGAIRSRLRKLGLLE